MPGLRKRTRPPLNRCRTKAGGDQYGQNLRSASYTPNSLNQYTSRTVPGYADIIGLANVSSTVNINGDTNNYRRGEYFHKALDISNVGTNPAVLGINVSAGGTAQAGKLMLPPATQGFLCDADGNLTNDMVWCYQWDAENRLIQMDSVAGLASTNRLRLVFEYDWKGRRIRKTVTNLATSTVILDTKFLYNEWNLLVELNGANNAVLRSYVWGLDLSGSLHGAGGVGGLLKIKDATQGTHFAVYDLNGNVMGLVNAANGTLSAQYEYGPFGEVIRMTGAMAKLNPFRFSTKYQDDETDLLYYGYRYYNPSTGRWLSRDPIEELGGLNLYAINRNDSINTVDALGLKDVTFSTTISGTTGGFTYTSPQGMTTHVPGSPISATITITAGATCSGGQLSEVHHNTPTGQLGGVGGVFGNKLTVYYPLPGFAFMLEDEHKFDFGAGPVSSSKSGLCSTEIRTITVHWHEKGDLSVMFNVPTKWPIPNGPSIPFPVPLPKWIHLFTQDNNIGDFSLKLNISCCCEDLQISFGQ